jgi:5'-nucleotidase
VNPPFIQTRLGGGGTTDKAVWNATSGIFAFQNLITDGNNVCINGDCALPGETPIVDNGCYGAVSVFTIDTDAPMGPAQDAVRGALQPLVAFANPDAKMMLKVRETESSEYPVAESSEDSDRAVMLDRH